MTTTPPWGAGPGGRRRRGGRSAAVNQQLAEFAARPRGSEKIWEAAVPKPSRPPTPRVMLTQLFGKGPRGGVNTKAAAQALGVSARTVQRWIKTRKLPDSGAANALRQRHEQWSNTPAGRKSALGRKNRDRIAGAKGIQFWGQLAISGDVRNRRGMEIKGWTPAHMDRLLDRLAAGDDPGAHAALEDLISNSAAWGGDVEIRIDQITFN